MRILLAPDSFKGSVTATAAAEAMAAGLAEVWPTAHSLHRPMADGGEGTVEAVLTGLGGRLVSARVGDPLGRPVDAAYGWVEAERLAVIEMAAASGLPLLAEEDRDPIRTSTVGTGQLIADALDRGARRIVVGLGGSATVDAGMGCLAALGARFRAPEGGDLPACGGALGEVETIDLSGLDPRLAEAEIVLATDVSNPLLGAEGAVHVFGPQKGLPADRVGVFEMAMEHFADRVVAATGVDHRQAPGSGAAGGIAFLLRSAMAAEVRDGFTLVAELAGLAEAIRGADLVITGEGRLDSQSLYGKVPVGVARMAREAGVPAAAIAGLVDGAAGAFRAEGLLAVMPIVDRPMTLADAMASGGDLIAGAAARLAAAIQLGRTLPRQPLQDGVRDRVQDRAAQPGGDTA